MNKDQKTALGVGGAGVLAFLFFSSRNKSHSSGQAPTLTSGAQGSVDPYTPQDPVVIDPGSSVYDPNTTGLYNTPTATYTTLPQTFPTGAPPNVQELFPPQTVAPSQPGYVVNVQYPHKPKHPPNHRKMPTKRPHGTRHRRRHHKKKVATG